MQQTKLADNVVGNTDLSNKSKENTNHYKKIGYNVNVKRQLACMVFTQLWLITFFLNYTIVIWASD